MKTANLKHSKHGNDNFEINAVVGIKIVRSAFSHLGMTISLSEFG